MELRANNVHRCVLIAALVVVAGAECLPRPPVSAGTQAVAKANEQQPASHELYEAERIKFAAPPPTMVQTGVQCDANGNIYAAYGGSFEATYVAVRSGASLPISKLGPDSKSVVQFPLGQAQGYTNYHRSSYYVDPRGKVYGLVLAYGHEEGDRDSGGTDSLIEKYKDDGTVDSVVRLKPPAGTHFVAYRIGAFLDGNFLVAGTEVSDKDIPIEPFTGIFDRGGTLVAVLRLANDVRPTGPEPPAKSQTSFPSPQASGLGPQIKRTAVARPWYLDVQQGLMVGSLDGNVYLLRASIPARLFVISPGGSVLREFQFKSPEPDTVPIQMNFTGQDELLLQFGAAGKMGMQTRQHLALLRLETGEITDTYDLPPKAGGIFACGEPRNQFLFLGTSKDNYLEVIKYVAR